MAADIGLFSRKVVDWSIDKNMKAGLVNDALRMAIWKRKPKHDLLWHTDRGSRYASDSHRIIFYLGGIRSGHNDTDSKSVGALRSSRFESHHSLRHFRLLVRFLVD